MTGQARREQVTAARRVVVKVGSSSLTTAAGGIDPERLRRLVDVLAAARSRGTEVVLVSSGAIAAGLAPLGLIRRPRALPRSRPRRPSGRACSCTATPRSSRGHGLVVGQVLLTVDDVTRRSHYRNAHQTFAKLLELGVLPIVNENDTVATGEIRFGDNDRLAALVAHLVHADLLVLLSDVDGLYDGPPSAEGSRLIARRRAGRRPGRRERRPAGAAGVGTGGHADQARGRPDRHRGRDPGGAHLGRAGRRGAGGGGGRHLVPGATGAAARPASCGWPTPPSRRASCCSTTAPSARSPSAARRCWPPG